MNSLIKLKDERYLMTMKILNLLALERFFFLNVTVVSIGLYLDGLGECI